MHLTQVANYSYNVSWLKEYELRVLRVGSVSDLTKDTLIDNSVRVMLLWSHNFRILQPKWRDIYICTIQYYFKVILGIGN